MADKNKTSNKFNMPVLAVAPMMDRGDLRMISNSCEASCASCVHASIARFRTTSSFLRSATSKWETLGVQLNLPKREKGSVDGLRSLSVENIFLLG